MTDREEIGGIENRHSEKKRKKIKNKKGKRDNIFEVNGSEISAKGYTLSKAVEGKKRKKQAGSKKEKTEEKNVPTRPRHDEGGMVYIKRKLGEKKKRRKREKVDSAEAENAFQAEIEEHVSSKAMDGKKSKHSPGKKKVKTHIESETEGEPAVEMLDNDFKIINGTSRKGKRKDKKAIKQSGAGKELVEDKDESPKEEVYHISSEDEDSPKGMKKWVMEYHQSRPGLKILQQRIDEFIIAHEAKLEQDRKEREARAAEGGWTVVTHHKGRKKTTESETGTVVGSVSEAALRDQAAKKKQKEVGLDFYRFQKREAQRNEIMMLQSKFEQDKKRIQQLRAARKFRPY